MPRWLLPVPSDRRLRRVVQLLVGLAVFGLSIGLQIRAELGLDPWNVLHEGLVELTGLSYGTVIIGVGAIVLLLWIPLRERPGLGTLANVVLIGVASDATLWAIPKQEALASRIPMMVLSIVLTGLAAALYIGAGLGPGPRDGLMTGLHGIGAGSIRLVRTIIEVTVLVVGFLLGGGVGVCTVLFAVAIGPLIQLFLPRVSIDRFVVRRREA